MGEPSAAVARDLDDVRRAPSVVSVGFFDGVHRGHQQIIGQAVRIARATPPLRAVVVTFDRHPAAVLRPGAEPALLMTAQRRLRTLAGLGVDLVVVLSFTPELSRLTPQEFVDEILVDGLDTRRAVVGSNFRFGHKAAGDVAVLTELGRRRGFDVDAVDLLTAGDTPISSSEIRRRLGAGDVGWAAAALGRPHVVDGVVARGEGRGQRIGIPTANLAVDRGVQIPGRGVYAGCVTVARPDGHGEDGPLPAVTNVGSRPTFAGETLVVESHVLDFSGDLYGCRLEVDFRHRLRDERRFGGVEELVAQIREDIRRGRELLSG